MFIDLNAPRLKRLACIDPHLELLAKDIFPCRLLNDAFPMSLLVNVWHLRRVAEASGKPCDICYKPTTSVLITPDNKVHNIMIARFP